MRALPFSFVFFLATGVTFLLQLFPLTGIFLMFMLAAFWSVVLINAGMLGVAFEAVTGRVSRFWLIVPFAFYVIYYACAIIDHQTVAELRGRFDAVNEKISIPFDPDVQSLIFDGSSDSANSFIQNYRIPVVYWINRKYSDNFYAVRMLSALNCTALRENELLGVYRIDGASVSYDNGITVGDTNFCVLSMPERPKLASVTVASHEEQTIHRTLPITRVTINVVLPSGQRANLTSGTAAPLSWFPMPVMGCHLISGGAPRWDCDAGFVRQNLTPLITGKARYGRDDPTLARALGLTRIEVNDRMGVDITLLRAKIAEAEDAILPNQLAAVERIIADPSAKEWKTDVRILARRPKVLAARADAIMAGLEHAAKFRGPNREKAAPNGHVLATLIASLDDNRFRSFGPRLLALYRYNHGPYEFDGRQKLHWIWQEKELGKRMANLGSDTLFIAQDTLGSSRGADDSGSARIE